MITVIIPGGHASALILELPWWWPSLLSAMAATLAALGRHLGRARLWHYGEALASLSAILIVALSILSRSWIATGIDLGLCALLACLLRSGDPSVD